MTRRSPFETEAELAEHVKRWLTLDGWEVYCEVAPWGAGGARADLVGVRGPLVCVVETKLTLGFALLEQCERWRGYAHQVWAAVPVARHTHFQRTLFERSGVGILHVAYDVSEIARPAFQRRIDGGLRKSLHESQRRSTPGTHRGGYSTPFSRTCTALLTVLRSEGKRLPVKEAIARISHHYSSTACARASLVDCAERGVVPGVRVVREGRAVYFEVAA